MHIVWSFLCCVHVLRMGLWTDLCLCVNVGMVAVRSVQGFCLSFVREFDHCVLFNIEGRGSGDFGQDCEVCTFALALAKPMEMS